MFIGFDIGNTCTTIALFEKEPIPSNILVTSTNILYKKNKLVKLLQEKFHYFDLKNTKGFIISSVVPSVNPAIEKALKVFQKSIYFISEKSLLSFKNLYTPKQLGIDRLCNAETACHEYPNKNVLIIDIGTATTLCLLTKDKVFHGGLIAPGPQTAKNGLIKTTAQLTDFKIELSSEIIPKSTQTALQNGLFLQTLGLIKEYHSTIEKELNEEIILILTGGLAPIFSKELKIPHQLDSNLLLKGLYYIFLQNF